MTDEEAEALGRRAIAAGFEWRAGCRAYDIAERGPVLVMGYAKESGEAVIIEPELPRPGAITFGARGSHTEAEALTAALEAAP